MKRFLRIVSLLCGLLAVAMPMHSQQITSTSIEEIIAQWDGVLRLNDADFVRTAPGVYEWTGDKLESSFSILAYDGESHLFNGAALLGNEPMSTRRVPLNTVMPLYIDYWEMNPLLLEYSTMELENPKVTVCLNHLDDMTVLVEGDPKLIPFDYSLDYAMEIAGKTHVFSFDGETYHLQGVPLKDEFIAVHSTDNSIWYRSFYDDRVAAGPQVKLQKGATWSSYYIWYETQDEPNRYDISFTPCDDGLILDITPTALPDTPLVYLSKNGKDYKEYWTEETNDGQYVVRDVELAGYYEFKIGPNSIGNYAHNTEYVTAMYEDLAGIELVKDGQYPVRCGLLGTYSIYVSYSEDRLKATVRFERTAKVSEYKLGEALYAWGGDLYIEGNVDGTTWNDKNGYIWNYRAPETQKMQKTGYCTYEWRGSSLSSGFIITDGTLTMGRLIPDTDIWLALGGTDPLQPNQPYTLSFSYPSRDSNAKLAFPDNGKTIRNPHVIVNLWDRTIVVEGTVEGEIDYFLNYSSDVAASGKVMFEKEGDRYVIKNMPMGASGTINVSGSDDCKVFNDSDGALLSNTNSVVTLTRAATNRKKLELTAGKYDIVMEFISESEVRLTFTLQDEDCPSVDPDQMVFALSNRLNDIKDQSEIAFSGEQLHKTGDGVYTVTDVILDGDYYCYVCDWNVEKALAAYHYMEVISDTRLNCTLRAFEPEQIGDTQMYYAYILDMHGVYDITFEFNEDNTAVTLTFTQTSDTVDTGTLTVTIKDGISFEQKIPLTSDLVQSISAPEGWKFSRILYNGAEYPGDYYDKFEYRYASHKARATLDIELEYDGEVVFVDSTTGMKELADTGITIGVDNGEIVVKGCRPGDEVSIYTLGAVKVAGHTAVGEEIRIRMDKGIYIVHVGNAAAKVAL